MRGHVASSVLLLAVCSTVVAWGQAPGPTGADTNAQKTPGPRVTIDSDRSEATLEGVVLDALTGAPLQKAKVTITDMEPVTSVPTVAVTDRLGHFKFADVEPGRYRMLVECSGYVRSYFGAQDRSDTGTPITLGAKANVRDIAVRLVPQATIAGRVVDDKDRPVARAQVRALQYRYRAGKRFLVPTSSSTTNAAGRYRLKGLSPGPYLVAADAPASNGSAPDYGTTFYPETPDPASAAAVEVSPAAVVAGVEVTLQHTARVRIRGRVESTAGSLPQSVMVHLLPREGFVSPVYRRQVRTGPQGNFEIQGVQPGTYLLAADWKHGNTRYSARQQVVVGTLDLNVELLLSKNADVTGTMTMEDGTGPIPDLYARLQGPDMIETAMLAARVRKDGHFVIRGVPPDQYGLEITGLPADSYIKAVRIGGQDVQMSQIDVGQVGTLSLEIVVASDGRALSGRIVDDSGRPATRAQIVVVPDDLPRSERQRYRTARAGTDGRFSVRGISPGRYKVFAWDHIAPFAYEDPQFLAPFEDLGTTVDVSARSIPDVELRLIRTDPQRAALTTPSQ